ncbi:MAG: DUF2141 domain-containing protein [Chitinophagaceae bacterium]|nr:MAG: DUF2141 domain-containing protein [Chitinophagaceae bacterium]
MKIFALASFLLFSTSSSAQNKISVQVTNFSNNKGACIVCLYDNPKAYGGKGEPLICTTVGIVNKAANASFDGIAEGAYAISVIHDANNNKKFDTNFLGIPTEGYGASQNKLPFAAAPKFEENKFTVTANSMINSSIKLRYIF